MFCAKRPKSVRFFHSVSLLHLNSATGDGAGPKDVVFLGGARWRTALPAPPE